jgi:hypothetical protein
VPGKCLSAVALKGRSCFEAEKEEREKKGKKTRKQENKPSALRLWRSQGADGRGVEGEDCDWEFSPLGATKSKKKKKNESMTNSTSLKIAAYTRI